MTPAEIREIARGGDPDIMAEALLQLADADDDADTYEGMRLALDAPPQSLRLLALLWRYRGHVVTHERIEDRLGIYGRESTRTAKRRLMPALAGIPVEIRAHWTDGYSLHVSGPVPWDARKS